MNFSYPTILIPIATTPGIVLNELMGLHYMPMYNFFGSDTLGYRVIYDGIASAENFVTISIQSFSYPPFIPPTSIVVIVNK